VRYKQQRHLRKDTKFCIEIDVQIYVSPLETFYVASKNYKMEVTHRLTGIADEMTNS
jgi:hypothetical protein